MGALGSTRGWGSPDIMVLESIVLDARHRGRRKRDLHDDASAIAGPVDADDLSEMSSLARCFPMSVYHSHPGWV